jgi:hypothetical protein
LQRKSFFIVMSLFSDNIVTFFIVIIYII